MGEPGPSTLTETRALISRLNLDPTIETMKSVESLRNHRQFVEQSTAYRDAIAGEKPSFPPLPLPSRIEEIPAPVAHMPPTGKRPKRTSIMTVGLPTGKKDNGKKEGCFSLCCCKQQGMRPSTGDLTTGVFTTPWMKTLQSLQVLNSNGL